MFDLLKCASTKGSPVLADFPARNAFSIADAGGSLHGCELPPKADQPRVEKFAITNLPLCQKRLNNN